MAKGFNIFKANAPTLANPMRMGSTVQPAATGPIVKQRPLIGLDLGPSPGAAKAEPSSATPAAAAPAEEVDPLEAFMSGLSNNLTEAERKALNGESEREERKQNEMKSDVTVGEERKETDVDMTMADATSTGKVDPSGPSSAVGPGVSTAGGSTERFYGDEEQVDESVIEQHNTLAESGLSWLEKQAKVKKKEIKPVDHAKMAYGEFRKNFYIESKEIAAMTDEEVAAYREHTMEGVKIRGKNCPKPIRSWLHCGLPDKVYAIIQKEGYKAPFPIQQQAIPAIMSGRDVIACAKTGSGKCWGEGTPMRMWNGDVKPVEDIVRDHQRGVRQVLMGDDGAPRWVDHTVVGHTAIDADRHADDGGVPPATYAISYPQNGSLRAWTCNGPHILVLCIEQPPHVEAASDGAYAVMQWQMVLEAGMELPRRLVVASFPSRPAAEAACASLRAPWTPIQFELTAEQVVHLYTPADRAAMCMYQMDGVVEFPRDPLTPTLKERLEAALARPVEDEAPVHESAWALGMCIAEASAKDDTAPPEPLQARFDRWEDRLGLKSPVKRSMREHPVLASLLDAYDMHPFSSAILSPALLTESSSIRSHLLAGCLDAAGEFDQSTLTFEWRTTKSSQLVDGVTSLCRSLGLKTQSLDASSSPSSSPSAPPPHGIRISGPGLHTLETTRPPSKQAPSSPVATPFASLAEPIHIRSIDHAAYYGFSLSGPSTSLHPRRCLLADYLVTHNTLAFVLPMLRHVLDQPPVLLGEGPIAVILAPTRELATQIYNESKKFCKSLHLRVVCVYGGASVADQIAQLKHGAEVVVATPGRMIDMLTINKGKLTNLHRTTYIVLDEADRMFDMGFEPQVQKIVDTVRPDKQIVLFSATFPRSIEGLAKKTLKNPIEIVIGGRSVASSTITQFVEVREAATKFPRLLEILGRWYKLDQCILIFVDKQEAVDTLFRQLNDAGYPCAALHGGMDQLDREFTVGDFKSKIRTIMVATSIVARGLDVKDLTLVVNYEVPGHYEDYVHRVGRTGRAGRAGTAITFIEPQQQKFAPDLVKGLVAAKQVVPKDLQKMADEWNQMRKEGKVAWSSNDGFGGSGYRFDESEAAENQNQRRLLKMADNPDADLDELAAISADAKSIEEKKQLAKNPTAAGGATSAATATSTADSLASVNGTAAMGGPPSGSVLNVKASAAAAALDPIARQLAIAKKAAEAARQAMQQQNKLLLGGDSTTAQEADKKVAEAVQKAKDAEAARQLQLAGMGAAQRAQLLAQKFMQSRPSAGGSGAAIQPLVGVGIVGASGGPSEEKRAFSAEVEINDYPQHARWKVTHKGALDQIIEETECAVTTKGGFFQQGRNPPAGERKLHLLIEGAAEMSVARCKAEIMRMLEEAALENRPEPAKYAKYSVV